MPDWNTVVGFLFVAIWAGAVLFLLVVGVALVLARLGGRSDEEGRYRRGAP